jgi:hypothetical protein
MRLRHPVPGARVSQPFGANPGTYRAYGLAGHEGIDYAVPVGTPVLAAHDGTAWVRRGSDTYGDYVTVQSETVDTLYAHLSRVDVAQGQAVAAGDIIGLSGNTGRSFGAHLHFGVRPNPIDLLNGFKGWVDPERFLGGEEEEGNLANIIGWHIGNGNAPTDTDWRILEAVPPKCIVFLPDEGTQPAHIERLLGIAPGCHIIMRPYYHPGAPLQEYIDQCKRAMDKYWPVVPAGQRHLQAYNEPNMPRWATWEGFGDQPDDLRRYNEWFCETYRAMKQHDPATRLGGPALTPGNRDVWFPSDPVGDYYLHGPEGCRETLSPGEAVAARLQSLCADALGLMDELYAHIYLHEGRGAWAEPWRGLRFERLRRFLPEKPLYITECGYPSRPTWPDWGDAALIDWLTMIKGRNVQGVALWILGDKQQWGAPWYEGGGPRPLVWTLAQWQQSAPVDVEAAIGDAAQAHILPLNPEAAFEKAAAARGLLPASREFDVAVAGTTYRAQAYRAPDDRDRQHIVYCVVGDWSGLRWFDRVN